jgi:hypothetical protein
VGSTSYNNRPLPATTSDPSWRGPATSKMPGMLRQCSQVGAAAASGVAPITMNPTGSKDKISLVAAILITILYADYACCARRSTTKQLSLAGTQLDSF